MDIDNLMPVEFDEYDCSNHEYALCPYCGYHNNIDGDAYGCQDEAQEDTCASCGKIFVRYTDYIVRFATEPFENYLIQEIKSMQRNVRNTKEHLEEECSEINKTHYLNHLKYFESQLKLTLDQLDRIRLENNE